MDDLSVVVLALAVAAIAALSVWIYFLRRRVASDAQRAEESGNAQAALIRRVQHLETSYGPVELAEQRAKVLQLQNDKIEYDCRTRQAMFEQEHGARRSAAEQDHRTRQSALEQDHTALMFRVRNEQQALTIEVEALRKHHAKLEELDLLTSSGFYKAHYDFGTSDAFAAKLTAIREKQKEAVKRSKAVLSHTAWSVGGDRKAGEKMIREFIKLVLRAFNGECDAAIAKVRADNVTQLEQRVEAAFEAINKIARSNQCEIARDYYGLKLAELRLTFEYQLKKQSERDEQREIREQMREEERAQREVEKAREEAEKEARRQEQAIERARKEAALAVGEAKVAFDAKLAELESRLAEAMKKVRTTSMAELTQSGHVYVLSNVGSFGEEVYKIGMTRRLDPMDRVIELGDASVPFCFDVHAMVFTTSAPALEKALHNHFTHRRVNRVNERKEFFRVTLDEIEAAVRGFAQSNPSSIPKEFAFTRTAAAEEFRTSRAIAA